MWCPQCKRVFDDGVTRCDECGVRLVEQVVSIRLPISAEPESMPQDELPVRRTRAGRRQIRTHDTPPEPDVPFDDETLLAAMEEFETVYGVTAEEEDPVEPVSPSGYHMVFVFLGLFALFIALALGLSLFS